MAIASINPATGRLEQAFEPLSQGAVESKLERAAAAFLDYRRTSLRERARWMAAAADLLERETSQLARIITPEMGKLIKAAEAEIRKCAWVCRYYAENAESFLRDEHVETDAAESFVHYQPLGPVLAVMPWNFPFWQVFRFAAPALMAGNVGLLKHASNVPRCALAIEDVLAHAGFPEGVFQTLLIGADRVAEVLRSPHVVAATLTGSEGAGCSLGVAAGAELKKTVLELGGSDPFVVMPSAELDKAVQTGVQARVINTGQSCIAAKRFIVAEEIADEFERRFVKAMEELKIGDPMDEKTDIAPLATEQVLNDLERQVRQSQSDGARVLTGGRRLDRPGYYYAPTVLADLPPACPAATEEIFGPVASLFRVYGIDEAIRLANDTRFGLGCSVWTNDAAERRRFIGEIEAGAVFVNEMVKSDPRLPFGGVKRSGYGRELGIFGIREFVNIKTVYIGAGR